MITRGYFIGQIIDELTSISEKVRSRSQLGLTDLNIYLEDFFKDIINIIFNYKLVNLNKNRSNNPGLDLGDMSEGIAFQITSTKTSEKVNKTLSKSGNKYSKIIILILQEKQKSYSLDKNLMDKLNFNEDDIWDINNLLSEIIHLKLDKLQELNDLINKEVAKIKIELEIPDKNGNYQTNIKNYIEIIPKESFSGISCFYQYLEAIEYEYLDGEEKYIYSKFVSFINELKNLPRITRQFYAFILDRGEWDHEQRTINYGYLKRVCSYPDYDGELRLLIKAGLCSIDEPEYEDRSEYWDSVKINITYPSPSFLDNDYSFYLCLFKFVEDQDLRLDSIIVNLDFSKF